MFTELLFIVSFVLLLRLFKSRRSRMIIGVLYSLLLVWFCLFRFELWQIHSSTRSIRQLKSKSQNTRFGILFNLHLEENDSSKIKLTGSSVWSESNGDVYYEVEGQKLQKAMVFDEEDEGTSKQSSRYLFRKDGVVVSYQGEKVFDATNNKPYTITITNVDNQPAQFEASGGG